MGKFNNVNVVPLYFSFGIVITAFLGIVYFEEEPKSTLSFVSLTAFGIHRKFTLIEIE